MSVCKPQSLHLQDACNICVQATGRVYTSKTQVTCVHKLQGKSTPAGHNVVLKKNSAELYFTKLNVKPQR